jgi:predicted negative regulator of RcsB-dependent stress response
MNPAGQVSAAIAGWLKFSESRDVPLGLSRHTALARADQLRELILKGRLSPNDVHPSEDAKDALWALVRRRENSLEISPADTVERVFQFLEHIQWSGSDEEDLGQIQCDLCFAEWQRCRAQGLPKAAQGWVDRYASSLNRSPALKSSVVGLLERLASDSPPYAPLTPELAFAACVLVRELQDSRVPLITSAVLRLRQELPDSRDGSWSPIVFSYLMGETALRVATGARLMGSFQDTKSWICEARKHFQLLPSPKELFAAADYAMLTVNFERGEISVVLENIDQLITRFQAVGAQTGEAKCLQIKGDMLKMAGRFDEAREAFEAEIALSDQCPQLRAGALTKLGSLKIIRGEYQEAQDLLRQADRILVEIDSPLNSGMLKATSGELQRHQGNLDVALELFSAALSEFSAAGMVTMVPRLRLERGEILLAMGKYAAAASELRLALNWADSLGLAPERAAARAVIDSIPRRREVSHAPARLKP